MDTLERKNASEWTRDWFSPRAPSIKIDVAGRKVDVMDTFLVLYSGISSSAASLQSKWFGAATIDKAMQTVSLLPSEACKVVWTLPKRESRRRVVPLDGMVRILKKIGTPIAVKLAGDMETALDEMTQNGAIVVSGLRDTQTTQTTAPTEITAAPQGTMVVTGPTTVIPRTTLPPPSPYAPLSVRVEYFKQCSEVNEIERTECKKANAYRREEELALAKHGADLAETVAKKRKIEEAAEHESHREAELAKIKTAHVLDMAMENQLGDFKKLHEGNPVLFAEVEALVKMRWAHTKTRLLPTTTDP